MILNRTQILAASDRKFVTVDVPEWGGEVRLVSLDADQALQQEGLAKKRAAGDTKVNPLTAVLASSIVDDEGNLIFTEKDLAELGKKSPTVLIRLITAVKGLNDLGDKDVKNSEATPAED